MNGRILAHLLSLWFILLCLTGVTSSVTSKYDNHNNSYPITKSLNISRSIASFTSETGNLDSIVNKPRDSDRPSTITTESFPSRLFNWNTSIPSNWSENANSSSTCRLAAVDPAIHESIRTLIVDQQIKLLEYHLVFPNYSVNPLTTISRYAYKLESWARASSRHGQTLMSLAFNYGILSLETLRFGTDALVVEMMDTPSGCVMEMNEEQVVAQLLYLLSRDFKDTEELMLVGESRICHEVIFDVRSYATFDDQCFKSDASGDLVETDAGNFWINLLYTMLMTVRFGVIFFGPLLLTSTVGKLSRKTIPYVVKFKQPLKKKIVLAKTNQESEKISPKKTIDLRLVKEFPKLSRAIQDMNITYGQPFDAHVAQYDILVNYKRLLTENRVPVGLWRYIVSSIFYCKIRNVSPFRDCCKVNMFSCCPSICGKTLWKDFWSKVGLGLMAICIPFPWYVRLWIFYSYEYAEVLSRKAATEKVGLKENLDNGLIHYYTPQHWIFTVIYLLYVASVCIVAYMTRPNEEGLFRKIIVGSFSDLENLSWFRVLQMLVSNVIWPFQMFGACGVFVAIVYWPIAIPITLVVFVLYSLPLIYLTIRMFFYPIQMFMETLRRRPGVGTKPDERHVNETIRQFKASYYFGVRLERKDETEQVEDPTSIETEEPDKKKCFDDAKASCRPQRHVDETIQQFEASYYFGDGLDMKEEAEHEEDPSSTVAKDLDKKKCFDDAKGHAPCRFFIHILASLLCVLSLFSILLILSECLGCLVEIIVFTMMGIIANAGTLLKYVSLVILVVVYSYDSFNNVEKKYLQLNKVIFKEVKGRIKDLDEVTSQLSIRQKNQGFKSQEQSQQKENEHPDDATEQEKISKEIRRWFINDLVLFVDNEDIPRIPKKLFDEVCQIKLAGVPGPVYRGLLFGIIQFLKIALFIFFVFVIVLSFGEVYKISSTNQMLATLAGGFLPVILRQFMEPDRPAIETGTVSFNSKLDEIIKNFNQSWPINDLKLKFAPKSVKPQQPKPDEKEHPVEHPNEYNGKETQTLTKIINAISLLKEVLSNVDSTADAAPENEKTQPESKSVDLLILLPDIDKVNSNRATTPLKHDIET